MDRNGTRCVCEGLRYPRVTGGGQGWRFRQNARVRMCGSKAVMDYRCCPRTGYRRLSLRETWFRYDTKKCSTKRRTHRLHIRSSAIFAQVSATKSTNHHATPVMCFRGVKRRYHPNSPYHSPFGCASDGSCWEWGTCCAGGPEQHGALKRHARWKCRLVPRETRRRRTSRHVRCNRLQSRCHTHAEQRRQ